MPRLENLPGNSLTHRRVFYSSLFTQHIQLLLCPLRSPPRLLHADLDSSLASSPRSSNEALYWPSTKVLTPFSEVLEHLLFKQSLNASLVILCLWCLVFILVLNSQNNVMIIHLKTVELIPLVSKTS